MLWLEASGTQKARRNDLKVWDPDEEPLDPIDLQVAYANLRKYEKKQAKKKAAKAEVEEDLEASESEEHETELDTTPAANES